MNDIAKTQKELNTLKQEYESVKNKLKELTDDELQIVVGGALQNEYYVGNSADEKRGVLK